jgi:hypothetical protein
MFAVQRDRGGAELLEQMKQIALNCASTKRQSSGAPSMTIVRSRSGRWRSK